MRKHCQLSKAQAHGSQRKRFMAPYVKRNYPVLRQSDP